MPCHLTFGCIHSHMPRQKPFWITVCVNMEGKCSNQIAFLHFGKLEKLLLFFHFASRSHWKDCVTIPTGVHFLSVAHSHSPDIRCHIHLESHVQISVRGMSIIRYNYGLIHDNLVGNPIIFNQPLPRKVADCDLTEMVLKIVARQDFLWNTRTVCRVVISLHYFINDVQQQLDRYVHPTFKGVHTSRNLEHCRW